MCTRIADRKAQHSWAHDVGYVACWYAFMLSFDYSLGGGLTPMSTMRLALMMPFVMGVWVLLAHMPAWRPGLLRPLLDLHTRRVFVLGLWGSGLLIALSVWYV